ncbi:MAG: hypothetical protein ACFFD9_11120 [Candidatus Thorarchaeota archaeon]
MKRLTPLHVGFILLLTMLLVPQAMRYYHTTYPESTGISVIAFLWAINYTSDEGLRIFIASLSDIGLSILLFGPGFLFIFQVIRYCQEEVGRTSTLILGVISVCPVLILMTMPSVIGGVLPTTFPLPTLFITGLILMRIAGPEPPTTPWDEAEAT